MNVAAPIQPHADGLPILNLAAEMKTEPNLPLVPRAKNSLSRAIDRTLNRPLKLQKTRSTKRLL